MKASPTSARARGSRLELARQAHPNDRHHRTLDDIVKVLLKISVVKVRITICGMLLLGCASRQRRTATERLPLRTVDVVHTAGTKGRMFYRAAAQITWATSG